MTRRKPSRPARCKPLSFKVEKDADYEMFEINAFRNGIGVGTMDLDEERQGELTVSWIRVNDPRCGTGTQMYQHAYRIACRRGKRLVSDVSRSDASEGFWSKQAKKGRATCVKGRGTRLRWSHRDSYFENVGHWPCEYYRMKTVCPRNIDLSGLIRRRSRRRSA